MLTTHVWNVLLIEDNAADASLVRICAQEHDGVEVFHAPNPILANRFIQRNSPFEDVPIPDLVLLDLHLPLLNGFDLLQGIRESSSLDHMPIVVLTSSIQQKDRERSLGLGASDYVVKPAEWGAWMTTITRIFRNHLPGFA